MSNVRCMNNSTSCTSSEVDEIECFVDKTAVIVVRGSGTCGAPLGMTEL